MTSACLSERLNAVFPSPSKDDEHFSPEADAAMSEMTGNTALLAQVCGWWAGGVAGRAVSVRGASGLIRASWKLTFKCLPSCGSSSLGWPAIFKERGMG